jgi:aspartyl-tRNA(Asn)/glutamyl-tRNA(Gln) amidotransferase subunit A
VAALRHDLPVSQFRDAALLLEIIAGHDARDPGSLQVERRSFAARGGRLNGLRIGFSPDLGYAAVASDVRMAFKQAVDTLANLGANMIADRRAGLSAVSL